MSQISKLSFAGSPVHRFAGFTDVPLYSVLIASIGLTEAALRAGR